MKLLVGTVGSKAYNLDTPESDIDTLGVFAHRTDTILSLYPYKDTFVYTNPDVTMHEVAKFCRLALKVNPTITELMWLNDYDLITHMGAALINLRSSFLSANYVRDAYFGYASQQLMRLKRRQVFDKELPGRTEKHARHLLRLLEQGYQLYTTGELDVRIESDRRGDFFEFGKDVANDPSMGDAVLDRYKRLFDEAKTVLPSEPDTAKVNSWLLMVREELL